MAAESSVDALSTNQTRSPDSAASAAWPIAFATVGASVWPMTAKVIMDGL